VRSATRRRARAGGLSKLNSVRHLAEEARMRAPAAARPKNRVEVDVVPGEPGHRTARAIAGQCPPNKAKAIDEPDAYRSKSSGIP
jgi:hypothetical protein